MLTVGKESTGLSKSILRGLKARFKRWPDAGDSCDVNRACELKKLELSLRAERELLFKIHSCN